MNKVFIFLLYLQFKNKKRNELQVSKIRDRSVKEKRLRF